jgi:hypothetical protein
MGTDHRGNSTGDNHKPRPMIQMRPKIKWNRPERDQSPPKSKTEPMQGSFGTAMADMIKKAFYDAEFNDIVGIPNDSLLKFPEGDK